VLKNRNDSTEEWAREVYKAAENIGLLNGNSVSGRQVEEVIARLEAQDENAFAAGVFKGIGIKGKHKGTEEAKGAASITQEMFLESLRTADQLAAN